MNAIHSTEIAELIGAKFEEGVSARKVVYGTFEDLNGVAAAAMDDAEQTQDGSVVVMIPVVFPEVADAADGAEPVEGLRYQAYAVSVIALQRVSDQRHKPWRKRQALLNELLLPALDGLAAEVNDRQIQPDGFALVAADVTGGDLNPFPELSPKGWLSVAATLTVTTARGR